MKSLFNKNIKKYYIIILLLIIGFSLFFTNNIKNLLLNIEPLENKLAPSADTITASANQYKKNNIVVDNSQPPRDLTPKQEIAEATSIPNNAIEKGKKLSSFLIKIRNNLETEPFSNNNSNNKNPCSACNHGGSTDGASIADDTCLTLCMLKGANGIK